MNTTSLFVELVVIGAGALLWLLLFVLAVFGWHGLPVERLLTVPALLASVPLVYLSGIVSDRVADALFGRWWGRALRARVFPGGTGARDARCARRWVMQRSPPLYELLEYGRSRLRICRGWALHSVLSLLALNLLLLTRLRDAPWAPAMAVFGNLFFALLAVGSWYAWRSLELEDHKKVRRQAPYLAREDGDVRSEMLALGERRARQEEQKK